MSQWRGVIGLLAVLIVFSPATLAQSDTEPPVLTALDFDPKSVDVTDALASVSCSMSAQDLPAGVKQAYCQFVSPGSEGAHCWASSPSSGDRFDGVFTCSVPIPQHAEEGVWYLATVKLTDNANNDRRWYTEELESLGFPTELLVVDNNEDLDPPSLVALDFYPRSVDVTDALASVSCSMSAQDLPAGVKQAYCQFVSPGSEGAHCWASSPSSGDRFDGVFTCSVPIPQHAEEGVWYLATVKLTDNANNDRRWYTEELESLGFPTELLVVDNNEDLDPPSLVALDFYPRSVDVTDALASVSCSMSAQDLPAGVKQAYCQFVSPRSEGAHCWAYAPSSGDRFDGVFTCGVLIPRYAEEGIWQLGTVTLTDNVNNDRRWYTPELESLGYPSELIVGFSAGAPSCGLTAPVSGRTVRGDSVTVRARLVRGDPAEVSPILGVRFDHRVLPFGEFASIPARNPNHPNPDTTYPYFIHWDVSGVPEGDYELRAAFAHDLAGTPDPAPETITITIDHAGPADVDEYVDAKGAQENQTAVDSASENKIASGDHTEASTATEVTLPPGSLTFTTDTAKLVYPDPADEEGQLEQPGQSIGAFVDLSLLSGQTDLESGMTGDLNVSYSDANQDGVVDGTSIREVDLELRHLDTGTNSYVVVPSIVLTEHNMVHAEPGFLGKFALAGPLMPQMWIETDKETLTWDAVSTATSYVVYRGRLSTLVDADADGLPDGGFGDCMNHLDGDPTDLLFFDPDDPGTGDGFYYLVGFVGADGATGLGNTSAGMRREPSVACP